nr:tRNA (N6-threonylcarbamoyladenosine(37)-N6)-methyltransferase TrmO [Methylonatrum kenyense]
MPIIGIVRSCFNDRFGIPRQPGLAPHATAELHFRSPYDVAESLIGLDTCSHIWVQFLFHGTRHRGWRPTVRPPRLGGNRRVGVFASRSPYRPAPVGLSVVALDGVEVGSRGPVLRLRNHDLADGTPVLDIKPYLPWSDSLPDALPPQGFDASPAPRLKVAFNEESRAVCERAAGQGLRLRELIEEVLRQDPRPAYRQRQAGHVHGMCLHGFNVRWQVQDGCAEVVSVQAQEFRRSI